MFSHELIATTQSVVTGQAPITLERIYGTRSGRGACKKKHAHTPTRTHFFFRAPDRGGICVYTKAKRKNVGKKMSFSRCVQKSQRCVFLFLSDLSTRTVVVGVWLHFLFFYMLPGVRCPFPQHRAVYLLVSKSGLPGARLTDHLIVPLRSHSR